MKNHLNSTFNLIKRALIADRTNRYLFIGLLTISGLDFLIWRMRFSPENLSLIWKLPFSPISYFAIIAVTNLLLSIGTYDNEKEISYLLFSTTIAISILVFILELFYLTNNAAI